jgi:hypothetical protein
MFSSDKPPQYTRPSSSRGGLTEHLFFESNSEGKSKAWTTATLTILSKAPPSSRLPFLIGGQAINGTLGVDVPMLAQVQEISLCVSCLAGFCVPPLF